MADEQDANDGAEGEGEDQGYDPQRALVAQSLEVNKLRQHVEVLKRANERIRDQYKQEIRSLLQPLIERHRKLQHENGRLQEKIEKLSVAPPGSDEVLVEELRKLRHDHGILQKISEGLEADSRLARRLQAELEEAQTRIEGLEVRVADLERERRRLEGLVSDRDQDRVKLDEALDKAQNEAKDWREKFDKIQHAHKDELRGYQQQLGEAVGRFKVIEKQQQDSVFAKDLLPILFEELQAEAATYDELTALFAGQLGDPDSNPPTSAEGDQRHASAADAVFTSYTPSPGATIALATGSFATASLAAAAVGDYQRMATDDFAADGPVSVETDLMTGLVDSLDDLTLDDTEELADVDGLELTPAAGVALTETDHALAASGGFDLTATGMDLADGAPSFADDELALIDDELASADGELILIEQGLSDLTEATDHVALADSATSAVMDFSGLDFSEDDFAMLQDQTGSGPSLESAAHDLADAPADDSIGSTGWDLVASRDFAKLAFDTSSSYELGGMSDVEPKSAPAEMPKFNLPDDAPALAEAALPPDKAAGVPGTFALDPATTPTGLGLDGVLTLGDSSLAELAHTFDDVAVDDATLALNHQFLVDDALNFDDEPPFGIASTDHIDTAVGTFILDQPAVLGATTGYDAEPAATAQPTADDFTSQLAQSLGGFTIAADDGAIEDVVWEIEPEAPFGVASGVMFAPGALGGAAPTVATLPVSDQTGDALAALAPGYSWAAAMGADTTGMHHSETGISPEDIARLLDDDDDLDGPMLANADPDSLGFRMEAPKLEPPKLP
ncbi:MAG: hypothetical protein H7338_08880 [Candidatus Sericytochromatia bacterium]|nr:hypothetical protein [Candidatus Sericytochromatia bacterium]